MNPDNRCARFAIAIAVLSGALSTSSICAAQIGPREQENLPWLELEQYQRFAQTMGNAPDNSWTIGESSALQKDRRANYPDLHPWSARLDAAREAGGAGFVLLPVEAGVILNSAFPFGDNDGAVWAGKGLTTVLRAGFEARWGSARLRFAPIFARAENSAFPLMNNGRNGRLQFADGQFPDVVDRPQRFGDAAYQVFDPGESSLTVEGRGLHAGLSTATQSWGPSERYQYVLSRNAAGFSHLFIGSREPLNVGIARLHGRVMWGVLEQSAYSPVSGPQYFESGENPGRRRFASGAVLAVLPRGIPGMEIGVTRFFHTAWPQGGIRGRNFTGLFQNFFKKNLRKEAPLPGSDNTQGVRDNQLFSAFARWSPPGTGFEAYGEFGREDHSYDLRDFLQEPDHGGASRLVGIRKMWRNGYALRAETINYEAPQLTKVRGEGSVYLHYVLRQGHTHKGQPLGANAGMGSGAGTFVAVDRYSAGGRTTWAWSRNIAHQFGIFYTGGPQLSNVPDVLHTLSLEALRFRKALDITGKLNLTMNFNRNFQSDVLNMNLQLGTAYRF